jgi:hypothetical protein
MLWGDSITLSLDPTSEGFCFVVLAGSETLLDWGCREVMKSRPEEWRRKIAKFIGRYNPDLIVLERMEPSRRGPWARRFAADVGVFARDLGIAVGEISRREVQEEFSESGRTKYEIAVAIARLFPELEPRLPRKRKPWMSEDDRMSIFDALAFALTHLRHEPADGNQGESSQAA